MSIIKVQNPNTSALPKTYLAVGQSSGVGTVYVKNVAGFSANWAIQIGESGESQSEIVLANASAPSGTQIVLTGTTRYEHPADTPLYALKYDQVVFAKSSAGTTGTSSPISNGTVTITPDNWDSVNLFAFTQFDDTAGATTDAYQTYFLNSVTSGSSALSSWLTPAGYSFYSLAAISKRIRNKLWNSAYIKDDSVIKDWINEWRDIMANEVLIVNADYNLGSVQVAFGTDGYGTINDLSFDSLRRVWVTYDGVNQYQSTKMNINDYNPEETFVTNHPYHYYSGTANNVVTVSPPSSGGTMTIIYYQFGTTLTNDSDTLPIPMRSYTDSFVDYGVAQAAFVDQKMDQYNIKMGLANAAKAEFVNQIAYRDKTGPSYVDIIEEVDGYDGMPL